jgi:hypothetical protein
MGTTVDTPETAGDVYNKLRHKEPLYFRCLVEVFKAWCKKTGKTPSPSALVIRARLVGGVPELSNTLGIRRLVE